MRIHEATVNFDKILIYLLTCVAILKYAENFDKTLKNKPITVSDVVETYFSSDPELASQIMRYWKMRKDLFCDFTGNFNPKWKTIEAKWFEEDKKFDFSLVCPQK